MNDDGTINLRGEEEEVEFKINNEAPKHELVGSVEVAPMSEKEEGGIHAHSKVKVKFEKFVNLVASHAYEEVFDKHRDESVIISTDLLTDLANSHEEKGGESKLPLIFVVGIVLGIGITWLLLR